MEQKKYELTKHSGDLKRKCDQIQRNDAELKTKFDEKVSKLKRRHLNEMNRKESGIELERNTHERTRQQFSSYGEYVEETFSRKLGELKERFSNTERRFSLEMSGKDEQDDQLQAQKQMSPCECTAKKEVHQEAKHKKGQLEEARRQQFSSYGEYFEDAFNRKLAGLKERFSSTENRFSLEMIGKDKRNIQLQAQKQMLPRECGTKEEVHQEAEHKKEPLVEAMRVNYLDKLCFENRDLNERSIELEKELKRCRNTLARTNPEPTSGVTTKRRVQSGKK